VRQPDPTTVRSPGEQRGAGKLPFDNDKYWPAAT